jgi:hypothetical protein
MGNKDECYFIVLSKGHESGCKGKGRVYSTTCHKGIEGKKRYIFTLSLTSVQVVVGG